MQKPPLNASSEPATWSSNARAAATSAIVIHGICVLIVLSANVTPSAFQERLIQAVAPYTRIFNFDPNFTRYHWTYAVPNHDAHRIVFEFGEDTESVVHMFGLPGSSRRVRYLALADYLAFFASQESDDVTALLARDLGAAVFRSTDSERLVVVGQLYEPPPMSSLPLAPEGRWDIHYSADVWQADGAVNVLKRVDTAEVAPPVSSSSEAGP